MSATKIDIDRLVREAKKQPVKFDWLELARAGKLPIRPTGWNILIEPHDPPMVSEGGIEMPEEARKTARIVTNCARVLALGPTALEGKTNSGIELSRLSDEIKQPSDLIGRWVIYQKHTGQSSLLRKPAEARLMNITASEILDLIDDPNDFIFWI